MAGIFFTAEAAVTPIADPSTMIQVAAIANHRVIIHSIEVYSKGATSASSPFGIYLSVQTTAGSGGNALTLNKLDSTYDESILTGAQFGNFSTEPTTTTTLWKGAIHEQGTLIYVPPPQLRFVIPGGTRVGLIQSRASGWNATQCCIRCEE